MSLPIHLRPATLSDLETLKRWDTKAHVRASDPNDEWDWELTLGVHPPWREQFIAEIENRPLGFVQIIDPAEEETHYWGNTEPDLRAIDIWIGEEDDLGKGYGTKMMELAIKHCFENPLVTTILIDPLASNTKAHRFYERLGFMFLRKQQFGQDACFVYQLTRPQWEEHRSRINRNHNNSGC